MKRKSIILAAFAFALVLGMGITPAGAYFTDQSTANGGLPIVVGPNTDIYEWANDSQKTIVITNAEGAAPAFVRVRIDTDAPMKVPSYEGWNAPDADGWYVYGSALAGGEETNPLTVTFDWENIKTDTREAPTAGDVINVNVYYEACDAKYDSDGNPVYGNDGDWRTIRVS